MIAPYYPTDEVVARAKRGDADAWDVLMDSHADRLFRLLLTCCRDSELAEEITQAAFVTAYERLSTYSERGCFSAWLTQVAMNKLRDEKRSQKRRPISVDMSPGDALQRLERAGCCVRHHSNVPIDPLSRIVSRETIELLRAAMSRLNSHEQLVLQLRYTHGLTSSQIAMLMDTPLGTVLARANRAQRKLRLVLR